MMRAQVILLLCLVCLLLSTGILEGESAQRNNVIVMVADDMSALYLDPKHPAQMPNLKNLARRGVECTNAHCSFPVCGPSRQSFLSGRFPDSTKIWTFERQTFQVDGMETIGAYLAKNYGYETIGFGKITHEDSNPDSPLARAQFLSGMWTTRQRGGGSPDNECGFDWYCKLRGTTTGDSRMVDAFTQFLATRNASRPLLAFLGFRKPHLDIAIPTWWFSRPQPGTSTLLTNTPSSLGEGNVVIPFALSLQRFLCFNEIQNRKIGRMKAYPAANFLRPYRRKYVDYMRKYYASAITWIDKLLGDVVAWIDNSPAYSQNTAIIFLADHGFAHGEHTLFCKNALFEQQTRVPFVAVPAKNVADAARGRIRTEPVNLVDLFPTAVELAVGTILPNQAIVDTSGLPIDGRSVVQSSRSIVSLYSFSEYPRCDTISRTTNWQCVVSPQPCLRRQNIFMGYAVRTVDTRYVEWRHFDDAMAECSPPNGTGIPAELAARLKPVRQVDPRAGSIWNKTPAQRELFDDFPSTPEFTWGHWELDNVLVQRMGNSSDIVKSHELSSAIRWRFDASFAGAPSQPCSGNGWVRLVSPALWSSFTPNVQPARSDVRCQCLPGFSGTECQVPPQSG